MSYDGLGRRIIKAVSNSVDWDCTYHCYFDGQSVVEERNGSDQVLKQMVWGRTYVDELVQVAINSDPGSDATCELAYWARADANPFKSDSYPTPPDVVELDDAPGWEVNYDYWSRWDYYALHPL
jgi:hypothetical protein